MSTFSAGRSFAPSTWDILTSQQREQIAPLDLDFERFLRTLKSRTESNSTHWCENTLDLIQLYINTCSESFTAHDFIILVTAFGQVFSESCPIELVIGNICRRVLYFIRQECAKYVKKRSATVSTTTTTHVINSSTFNTQTEPDISLSLSRLFDSEEIDLCVSVSEIRSNLEESVAELRNELEMADNNVADQSSNHIYSNEALLTYGYSRLVLAFFKQTNLLHRKIEVFVCEGGTSLSGQRMASDLAKIGVNATLVPDSAVYALLPSISKIILGTHAVLANGGLVSHSGGFGICVSAKALAVPVVVLTGLHKLSPQYAFTHDTFNEQLPPSDFLKFDQVLEGRVDVINPGFDYVPPEYVDLFVTNYGTYQPSYIYRLISEYYSPVDHALHVPLDVVNKQ